MAVVTITNENFEDEVLAAKVPVVLDFWAEWCGPCKMQSPIFEALSEELAGKVKFGSVNVDEQAALALKYQVMSIPMLVVMQYGIFEEKSDRTASEEILDLLACCEAEPDNKALREGNCRNKHRPLWAISNIIRNRYLKVPDKHAAANSDRKIRYF